MMKISWNLTLAAMLTTTATLAIAADTVAWQLHRRDGAGGDLQAADLTNWLIERPAGRS